MALPFDYQRVMRLRSGIIIAQDTYCNQEGF
jgi:hypothetical protein